MLQPALYASQSSDWGTPQGLFNCLNTEFGFTLDPCSTHENAKCDLHFTKAEDGLIQDWRDQVVFMNPPYGREIARWMKKAFESSQNGATVVCLVPSRTDTRWWHTYAMRGELRFLQGRVRFVGGKHSAPFPSAVVVFRPTCEPPEPNCQICQQRMAVCDDSDDPGGRFICRECAQLKSRSHEPDFKELPADDRVCRTTRVDA